MNNVNLENALISVDIVDLLQDYCAIQLDIDSTKVKAAAHVAQTIDITRIIGATNLERIKSPQNDARRFNKRVSNTSLVLLHLFTLFKDV